MGKETNKRLASAAAFLVLVTMGSRVLGLVREIVMVSYLGLGTDNSLGISQKIQPGFINLVGHPINL